MKQTCHTVEPLPPHRPLPEFYTAPVARGNFVNSLFDEAAPDYDWLSRLMSFGTDRRYRREALHRAGLQPRMRLLDVASGTGLMVRAALELGLAASQVTGVDPSAGMLAQNRRQNAVNLLQGRGERLPVRDASFDFVCMGYALRHVEDLHALFREFRRVLCPGGRLLILEITRPANPVMFGLLRFHMQTLLPLLLRLRRGKAFTARLMEYYWATIAECVPPEAILHALDSEGFEGAQRKTTGPILSEYVAGRPAG